jgi:hypothetical protein
MKLEEYLTSNQAYRQQHLALNEDCIERGGNSTNHRGVLAQYLNTPIYGKPADLCHACYNDKCSNPKHLYWGTRKENVQDAKNNGTYKSVWQNLVEKHGYEMACKINARGNKAAGGKANKGKPKSEEHKRKIRESLKRA